MRAAVGATERLPWSLVRLTPCRSAASGAPHATGIAGTVPAARRLQRLVRRPSPTRGRAVRLRAERVGPARSGGEHEGSGGELPGGVITGSPESSEGRDHQRTSTPPPPPRDDLVSTRVLVAADLPRQRYFPLDPTPSRRRGVVS